MVTGVRRVRDFANERAGTKDAKRRRDAYEPATLRICPLSVSCLRRVGS